MVVAMMIMLMLMMMVTMMMVIMVVMVMVVMVMTMAVMTAGFFQMGHRGSAACEKASPLAGRVAGCGVGAEAGGRGDGAADTRDPRAVGV